MDITYRIQDVENFKKIIINVKDYGRPVDASVSVSVKVAGGKEFIFIPAYVSYGKFRKNTTYPEEHLNFVNVTDIGEYTLFFYGMEKIKAIHVFVQYADVVEDKVFEI